MYYVYIIYTYLYKYISTLKLLTFKFLQYIIIIIMNDNYD